MIATASWLALSGCDEGRSGLDVGTPDAGKPSPPPARPAGSRAPPPVDPPPDAGPRPTPPADDDAGGVDVRCAAGACDLLDPLACESNEGCVLAAVPDAGVSAVCAAVGAGDDGSSCESFLDCSPGLDCTATGGTGTCRRYCCQLNRTAGCPETQFCRVALTTPSGDGVGTALCDRCDQCDLLGTTGCPAKQACYTIEAACTACLPAGSKAVGEACRHANECVAGSTCARLADSDQRCLRFCARDDGAECAADERCVAVAAMALPEGVGACVR